MTDTESQLTDAAWPYWEAEAEIAKRFYAKATNEDHVFYLRAQLWKELNPVDGYFNGLHRELTSLVEKFPKVGKEIDVLRLFDLGSRVTSNEYRILMAWVFLNATATARVC